MHNLTVRVCVHVRVSERVRVRVRARPCACACACTRACAYAFVRVRFCVFTEGEMKHITYLLVYQAKTNKRLKLPPKKEKKKKKQGGDDEHLAPCFPRARSWFSTRARYNPARDHQPRGPLAWRLFLSPFIPSSKYIAPFPLSLINGVRTAG